MKEGERVLNESIWEMNQNKSQRCEKLSSMMFKALSNETNEIFAANTKGNLCETAFKALNWYNRTVRFQMRGKNISAKSAGAVQLSLQEYNISPLSQEAKRPLARSQTQQ